MSSSIDQPQNYVTWMIKVKEMRDKTPKKFADDKQCWEAATKLCTGDGQFANLHFRTLFKREQSADGQEMKRVAIPTGTTVYETAFRLRYGWDKAGASAVLHDGKDGYFASFGDPFMVYDLDPSTGGDGVKWGMLGNGFTDLVHVRWSKTTKTGEVRLAPEHKDWPKDKWLDRCFNCDLLQSRAKRNGKELAVRLRPLEQFDEQFVESWYEDQAVEAVNTISNAKPAAADGAGGVAAAGPAPEATATATAKDV